MMARPRKEISDEDFQRIVAMIRIQCTRDEICGILDMSASSLDRRLKERGEESFEALYKRHQDEGKASLRRAQWKAATENLNPTMLIWLGKQMLGQKDRHEVANTHDMSDPLKEMMERIANGSGRIGL